MNAEEFRAKRDSDFEKSFMVRATNCIDPADDIYVSRMLVAEKGWPEVKRMVRHILDGMWKKRGGTP